MEFKFVKENVQSPGCGQRSLDSLPMPEGTQNFSVGGSVEVWSNSYRTWCRGTVEHVDNGMVTARFYTPDGARGSKTLPDGHPELRLASDHDLPPPASYPAHGHTVLVDAQEDAVDPTTGKKRVAKLSIVALHGEHINDSISRNEHGLDTCDYSLRFEPNPRASQVANLVVQQALSMIHAVSQERTDVFDNQWRGPHGYNPLLMLFNQQHPDAVCVAFESLAMEVQQVLASQPPLVEAEVPAKVFGDIHGQFRDMLLLMFHYGFPQSTKGPNFIFNGDWADRGAHQLEVISLVFALKAMFPTRVWLVRGNHEDCVQNQAMGHAGLHAQCHHRLGQQSGHRAFQAMQYVFNWLPLGCLINRKILVVHGGIGDGKWSLNHLRNVHRPLDHDAIPRDSVIYNVLWSDPIPDDPGDPREHFGVHDSPRDHHAHMIITFGSDVTAEFCARNHLEMVVRSHQALKEGFGYDVMHDGRCVRVFSARDYEGCGNDGAVLSITEGAQHRGQPPHYLVRAQVIRSLACPKRDD